MRAARRPPELRREYERLLGVVLVLVVMGAVWVYSASSSEQILASGGGNGTQFLIRYVLFGALGFGVLVAASRYGVAALRRLTLPLLGLSLVLCLAVMVPGIGQEVNGASRWLGAGAVRFQPAELAKFSMVAFLALTLADRRRPMTTLKDVLPHFGVLGAFVLVVGGLQQDLGTAIVISAASLCVLVAAGMPIRFFLPLGAIAGTFVLLLVLAEPYRMARLASFVSPWAHADGSGYQATQGQLAIGSGGIFGVGLGNGVQKAEWLPEAHTDFILAVIQEELGAFGVLLLLALYAAVAYLGLRIADQTKGTYQRLLATGITSIIVVQALLNVWVVLGIFPLTGVPLPFISYGSTNLIVLLAGVGVLLNIARGTPHLAGVPSAADRRAAERPDGDPPPRGRAPRAGGPRSGPQRRGGRGAPAFGGLASIAGARAQAGPRTAADRAAAARLRASRSGRESADVRDRSRRDGGARGAGAGGRRRAAS